MTPEEKKNVIIGALLCVGAVVVLFLWTRSSGNLAAPPASTETLPDFTQTSVPAPGYTNYNIPSYTPGNASYVMPMPANMNGGNGGNCCGSSCGAPSNVQSSSVNNYLAIMGR